MQGPPSWSFLIPLGSTRPSSRKHTGHNPSSPHLLPHITIVHRAGSLQSSKLPPQCLVQCLTQHLTHSERGDLERLRANKPSRYGGTRRPQVPPETSPSFSLRSSEHRAHSLTSLAARGGSIWERRSLGLGSWGKPLAFQVHSSLSLSPPASTRTNWRQPPCDHERERD